MYLLTPYKDGKGKLGILYIWMKDSFKKKKTFVVFYVLEHGLLISDCKNFCNPRKNVAQSGFRFFPQAYIVRYRWGRVPYFNQSEAVKHCFLAYDWMKYGTLPHQYRYTL